MLFEIAQEYLKLERVEIAGLKGKVLCANAYDVYEEFTKLYNEFSGVQYEILLPEEIGFTEDITIFLKKVF